MGGSEIARWATLDSTAAREASKFARSALWAVGLERGSLSDLVAARLPGTALSDQLTAISWDAQRIIDSLVNGSAAGRDSSLRSLGGLSPSVSSTPAVEAVIAQHQTAASTFRKLSMFAGALDVVGPGLASTAAFGSLLGDWRTQGDLPTAFWRTPEVRKRHYRDAEVDPGLIEFENGELIELLVGTGLVDGETHGERTNAVVMAGPVSVRIMASRPRQSMSRVLAAFELGLRGFVEEKLRTAMETIGENPEDWFKKRMPGDVLVRAKERSATARLSGELPAPLIAFVDLGDFTSIITQKSNWSTFEGVFASKEDLRVDIARLNAMRRPIAHLRPIDPVQMTEMVLTVARLTKAMTLHGGWDAAWDDES